jgi:hypothetical protein
MEFILGNVDYWSKLNVFGQRSMLLVNGQCYWSKVNVIGQRSMLLCSIISSTVTCTGKVLNMKNILNINILNFFYFKGFHKYHKLEG